MPGNNEAIEVAFPESRRIGKYTVEKLPLGAYFSLIRKLDDVPRDILNTAAKAWGELGSPENEEEQTENNAKFLDVILKVVSKFPDEVLEIVASSVCIDNGDKNGAVKTVTKQDLENDKDIGLDGLVDLAVAVWEVNRLDQLLEKVKKKIPEKARSYLANLLKSGEIGSMN